MDKVLYTAMVGAKEIEHRQSVNANNIANASNAGFKRQIAATRALQSSGPGMDTRVYAMTHTVAYDKSEGGMKFTGQSTDVTVRGDAWFKLEDGDGQYLTKNLNLTQNNIGQLVDVSGAQVVTQQGAVILPPGASVELSDRGEVFVKFPEDPQLIKVADLEVVSATDLLKNNKGQLYTTQEQRVFQPNVVVGAVQQSNVNIVSTTMDSVSLSSQFNMNMRVFETAKRLSDTTNRLMGN